MLKPEDIIECCLTCKYLAYSSCSTDRAYCSGKKDAPSIECPDHYVCDRYKSMLCKTDPPEPSPVVDKQVTTTTTVFNPDFWKVGDVYAIRCYAESAVYAIRCSAEPIVFVSVLENVNDFCVTFENGVDIQLNSILNNRVSVIKHITKESLVKIEGDLSDTGRRSQKVKRLLSRAQSGIG